MRCRELLRASIALAGLSSACLSVACVGDIGDRKIDDSTVDTACLHLSRRLSLLTARQYGKSVRDLLGLGAAPHLSSAGGNADALFHGGSERVSAAMAFELHVIAAAAAEEATESLDALTRCDGQDEDTCAADFAARFGARAFRRPLDPGEAEKLLAVYHVGKEQDQSFRGGIQLMVQAILEAPSFLYRTELGTAGEDGTWRLTSYELMTELSFFLSDTVPDDQLWEAAQSGRLDDVAGVQAEVDRLLADPTVRANVVEIFLRWMGTRQLGLQKNDPTFSPALRASMITETEMYVDRMLFTEGADLAGFFTSRATWVDQGLADLYGVTYPGAVGDGFLQVELPADRRAGFLTQPSLMATYAETGETSVVRRGLFVYRNVLCQTVSPPPAEAAAVAEEIAKTEHTQRGRAEARMENQICGACHKSFDPYGVLFENYDAIGRYRTEADGEPVDASWDVERPQSLAGPTANAIALVDRLARNPEVAACTTEQLLAYAVGTPLEDAACMTDDILLEGEDPSALTPVEIVRRIALSAALRVRVEGGAQ
jgi:hypothetical protein